MVQGRQGYGDFINGHYDVEAGILHDEHPVYRKTTTITSGNGVASGRYLFLFYNSNNQAWAIAQNLGSTNIFAYASRSCETPETLQGVVWKVANQYKEFIDDEQVSCGMSHFRMFLNGIDRVRFPNNIDIL